MKWKNLIAAGSLWCGVVGMTGIAQAVTVEQVKTFTLPNGMKFLVLENTTIPNANMYTYWKVGSRNEVAGITGLSHFFEHMMFNGSKKFGPKQFDRTMEANGGANNAYTSNDVTVYQDWFPAVSLPTIFDLESDRIANLSIDPKMVESERGVVLSERSTGLENSNLRALWGEVYASAFRAHPYSVPTIGHESDIKAWTQDDLQKYFNVYYSPNNAVAVIVGDVKADEVKRLAEQYFANVPKRALPPAVRTVEPEQKGERRVFVRKESATAANLMISYKVPATNHPDYYALNVISSILTDGNTSRLYQALVDKRLATQVGSDQGKALDPGLFNFFAVAANKVPAAKVEEALLAEIDRLIKDGISEEELQKVKNQKLLNFYRTQETINGKAAQLGEYEVFFGDYKKLFDAPEAYRKLTVADIKTVAAKYFKKSQRTVGVLAAVEE
ncbi:M16 family metallopeptidase [Undibacterium sp. Ji49W]|uniref:M16 family metallopeptidase n=1 Tax=Undibacterium sp. Ji49W TaxID=3413040 RepID=UPI003BF1A339